MVRIGSMEDQVIGVDALSVKLVKSSYEEVTLPNSLVAYIPIQNFSRLADERGARIGVSARIGYDAGSAVFVPKEHWSRSRRRRVNDRLTPATNVDGGPRCSRRRDIMLRTQCPPQARRGASRAVQSIHAKRRFEPR